MLRRQAGQSKKQIKQALMEYASNLTKVESEDMDELSSGEESDEEEEGGGRGRREAEGGRAAGTAAGAKQVEAGRGDVEDEDCVEDEEEEGEGTAALGYGLLPHVDA